MANIVAQPLVKKTCVAFFVAATLSMGGCAVSRVAPDLLANVKKNEQPLTSSWANVRVDINPKINNYEAIDDAVRQSLELALKNANVFGNDITKQYKIQANVLTASQSPISFGNFNGKLEVRYVVTDPAGNQVLDKTIYTEAGADRWHFVGAVRHARARAVNISKNVLQFVDVLETTMKNKASQP